MTSTPPLGRSSQSPGLGQTDVQHAELAANIGTSLSMAMQAVELRSGRYLEQELMPQLMTTGAQAASTSPSVAAGGETVVAAMQPLMQKLATTMNGGGDGGVSADEVGSSMQEAALLVLGSVSEHIDRKTARELLKPYAGDVVHAIANRFPKLRPAITIMKWFGPKDVCLDAPPETWQKAQTRVLVQMGKMMNQSIRTLTLLRSNNFPYLYEEAINLEACLKCELPVLVLAGDKGTGKSGLAAFLLHPYLGREQTVSQYRGVGNTAQDSDVPTSPLLSATATTNSRSSSHRSSAFSGATCNQRRSQAHHGGGMATSSTAVSSNFIVYMYADSYTEWSQEALIALSRSHPFAFLKKLGLNNNFGSSSFAAPGSYARTTVRGVGIPHPLLRTLILVDTPGTSGSSPKTSADFLNLLDSFISVADRVWLLFDRDTPKLSLEMCALLSTHRSNIVDGGGGDKFKFIWNTHKTQREQEEGHPEKAVAASQPHHHQWSGAASSSANASVGSRISMDAQRTGNTRSSMNGAAAGTSRYDNGVSGGFGKSNEGRIDSKMCSLYPYGALHFSLGRALRAKQPPHFFVIGDPRGQGAASSVQSELFRLLWDITESVPLQFLDTRIHWVLKFMKTFRIHMKAIDIAAEEHSYEHVREKAKEELSDAFRKEGLWAYQDPNKKSKTGSSAMTRAKIEHAHQQEMFLIDRLCDELSLKPLDIPTIDWMTVPSAMKALTTSDDLVAEATKAFDTTEKVILELHELYGTVSRAGDPISKRFTKTIVDLIGILSETTAAEHDGNEKPRAGSLLETKGQLAQLPSSKKSTPLSQSSSRPVSPVPQLAKNLATAVVSRSPPPIQRAAQTAEKLVTRGLAAITPPPPEEEPVPVLSDRLSNCLGRSSRSPSFGEHQEDVQQLSDDYLDLRSIKPRPERKIVSRPPHSRARGTPPIADTASSQQNSLPPPPPMNQRPPPIRHARSRTHQQAPLFTNDDSAEDSENQNHPVDPRGDGNHDATPVRVLPPTSKPRNRVFSLKEKRKQRELPSDTTQHHEEDVVVRAPISRPSSFLSYRLSALSLLQSLEAEEEVHRCSIMGGAWASFAEFMEEFQLPPPPSAAFCSVGETDSATRRRLAKQRGHARTKTM